MNRQDERYSTQRDVWLSSPQIDRHEVVLQNISKTGASIMCNDFTLMVGEQVSVEFGEGDVTQGTVIWCAKEKVGVAFD